MFYLQKKTTKKQMTRACIYSLFTLTLSVDRCFIGCLDDFNEAGLSAIFTRRHTGTYNKQRYEKKTNNIFEYVSKGQSAGSKKINHMRLVKRKPAFCMCENKDADQLCGNREADQRLCFRYTDRKIPLLPKFEISSH